MDPTWKMNHLFSAELFPTVIRNMARAVCNSISRIGGILAPTIVHSAASSPLVPVTIFSVMLTIMLAVELLFLTETANKPLPDVIPEEVAEYDDIEGNDASFARLDDDSCPPSEECTD